MTENAPSFDPDDFRERIVSAVQAELDRHASVVLSETAKLRDEARDERIRAEEATNRRIDELAKLVEDAIESREDRIRAEEATSRRVDALATIVDEQAEARERHERSSRELMDESREALRSEFEQHLSARLAITDTLISESEARSARRLEQAVDDLDGVVEAVAHPLVEQVRDQTSAIARRVDQLSSDLHTFDEQAARMVRFVHEISESVDTKGEELAARIEEATTRRVAGLDQRIEEAMALSLRQHVETTQRVKERTERIEERLAERAYAFEEKLQAEAGQRIADIDAHLGRVAAGLDDTVEVLNERLSGLEDRIGGFDGKIAELRAEFDNLDSAALDGIKEQVSSALGEATLVRIDMDRLTERLTTQVDELNVRVAEVQSELADATMDVNTAVQLERLEELERAVIELDPSKFVLKDGVEPSDYQVAGHLGSSGEGAAASSPEGAAPSLDDDPMARMMANMYDSRATSAETPAHEHEPDPGPDPDPDAAESTDSNWPGMS